ncbi:lipase family protein [Chitinophaga costaii]|nr:lipase family protein [Chitinophaga costaii]
MKRFRYFWLLALCWGVTLQANAQHLQAGFDAREYEELLRLSIRHRDTPWRQVSTPAPASRLVYRSPVTGLQNRWDLWLRPDGVGIISIRGTTGAAESWMENFYAGMIAAQGSIHLNDTTNFPYRVATDSAAYVHVGWMIGLASLAPDIVQKIKAYYRQGIHEYIIMGHSQGGAIAFLLRSYLAYLDDPDMPKDIVYKTYCSAAPKPGNLYYAYDFDYLTRNGWGFRIVNARDWVPETPFSLQTTRDMNPVSPFPYVKPLLKKQKLLVRWVVRSLYNKMDRSSRKASRRMAHTLGPLLGKRVKQSLPGYVQPPFAPSNAYMTAGSPVILQPTPAYYARYPFDGKNVFVHHQMEQYLFLLHAQYAEAFR